MSLKQFDFFALNFGFTYDKSIRYQTILGAFSSFSFAAIYIIVTFTLGKDFFDKNSNLTFNTATFKYSQPPALNFQNFPANNFAISILANGNYYSKIEDFKIHFSYYTLFLGNNSEIEVQIPLYKCNETFFDSGFRDNLNMQSEGIHLCPNPKDLKFPIIGTNNMNYPLHESVYYYKFSVMANISLLLTRPDLTFEAEILYTDISNDPFNFEIPIKQIIASEKILISNFNFKTMDIFYQYNNFTTEDYNIFFYPITRDMNFLYAELGDTLVDFSQIFNLISSRLQNNSYYQQQSQLLKTNDYFQEMININIKSGNSGINVQRKYLKLTQVVSNISGIMNVVFHTLTLINFFYAKTSFFTKLTKDSIFLLKDVGDTEKSPTNAKSTESKRNSAQGYMPTAISRSRSLKTRDIIEMTKDNLIMLNKIEPDSSAGGESRPEDSQINSISSNSSSSGHSNEGDRKKIRNKRPMMGLQSPNQSFERNVPLYPVSVLQKGNCSKSKIIVNNYTTLVNNSNVNISQDMYQQSPGPSILQNKSDNSRIIINNSLENSNRPEDKVQHNTSLNKKGPTSGFFRQIQEDNIQINSIDDYIMKGKLSKIRVTEGIDNDQTGDKGDRLLINSNNSKMEAPLKSIISGRTSLSPKNHSPNTKTIKFKLNPASPIKEEGDSQNSEGREIDYNEDGNGANTSCNLIQKSENMNNMSNLYDRKYMFNMTKSPEKGVLKSVKFNIDEERSPKANQDRTPKNIDLNKSLAENIKRENYRTGNMLSRLTNRLDKSHISNVYNREPMSPGKTTVNNSKLIYTKIGNNMIDSLKLNSFHILKFIKFGLSNSLYSICCISFCSCFKNFNKQLKQQSQIFEFSKNYFEKYLDFNNFLEKFVELDLIKHFLFDKEQLKLINQLKHIIIIDRDTYSPNEFSNIIHPQSIHLEGGREEKETHDKYLSSFLRQKTAIKITNYNTIATRLQKCYIELSKKEEKTLIEDNLFNYLHELSTE
jgi:hypothetical protein